jgi:hypothetical protein
MERIIELKHSTVSILEIVKRNPFMRLLVFHEVKPFSLPKGGCHGVTAGKGDELTREEKQRGFEHWKPCTYDCKHYNTCTRNPHRYLRKEKNEVTRANQR